MVVPSTLLQKTSYEKRASMSALLYEFTERLCDIGWCKPDDGSLAIFEGTNIEHYIFPSTFADFSGNYSYPTLVIASVGQEDMLRSYSAPFQHAVRYTVPHAIDVLKKYSVNQKVKLKAHGIEPSMANVFQFWKYSALLENEFIMDRWLRAHTSIVENLVTASEEYIFELMKAEVPEAFAFRALAAVQFDDSSGAVHFSYPVDSLKDFYDLPLEYVTYILSSDKQVAR